MRRVFWAVAVALTPVSIAAQPSATPPAWRWMTDGPVRLVGGEDEAGQAADALWFVPMAPGFHITMGPGGVLYHPSIAAEGRFELESEFFLFPGSSVGEYGLFAGGKDLDQPGAGWVAFLARRDGSAAVVRRRAGRTDVIREWRPSSAIVPGKSEGTARNVLKVVAGADVVFHVNGAEVARLPRDSVSVDGVAGFRSGAGLNLHVATFDLTRRIAPIPAPRPR